MARAPSLYALHPDEKIGPGFIRVLGQIADRAGQVVRHPGNMPDAMHEVRLLIKRSRALLWFAKPALTRGVSWQAKVDLRKASRLLSAPRDLAVRHATLTKLSPKIAGSKNRKIVARVSNQLRRQADLKLELPVTEHELLRGAGGLLLNALMAIRVQAEKARTWPSTPSRVAKAFHTMRQARKKAARTGSDADFHRWRKKTKRLLFELEWAHPTPNKKMVRTLDAVDRLQEKLGIHHDYVVTAEGLGDRRSTSLLRGALQVLEKKKARLRKKTQKIAKTL
jgi:CHAD domain-containing protein